MKDLYDRMILTIFIVSGVLSIVFAFFNVICACLSLEVAIVDLLIFVLKKIWE